MRYGLISKENEKFNNYCYLCRDNVVIENLIKNGGTLQVPNAVFYSNVIIIAYEDHSSPDDVIGFVALDTRSDYQIYINQIGVKNSYKRVGIGKELVEQLLNYANDRDVICHVRGYNIASQSLFKSCEFIKDDFMSSEENYFYRHKSKNLVRGKHYDIR